jgi:prepilin peptidase CpaA
MGSLTIVSDHADDQPGATTVLHLQHAALIGFAALMVAAAFEDLRRLMIPNPLPLGLCLLWPLYILATPSWAVALGAIGCAIIVFAVGVLFFSRGFLGGGDVKLLTAATLWAGPTGTPSLLLLTAVIGGALALFLLVPPGAHLAMLARGKLGPVSADLPGNRLTTPVPYGIAIAAAAMIVVCFPYFR